MATAKKTPAAEKAATPAKETKKTATKATAPKKETKTAEKKPAAKKTTATKTVTPKVYVEYLGNQVSLEDILAAVQAAAGKAKATEIYVKPEDGAAYYVAGDESGKVEF